MPNDDGNGQGSQADLSFQNAFNDALGGQQQPPPQQQVPAQQAIPPQPQQTPAQLPAPPAPAPAPPPPQQAPPVQQPLAPPAQQPQQPLAPAPPPQLSPLAQQAADAGVDVDGMSDDDIVAAMSRQIAQMRPYAQYGQQMMPHADEIAQMMTQRSQEPAPPSSEDEWTPESYFQQSWNAPKWDEQYTFAIQQGMVNRNPETGAWEANPGFESMVAPMLTGLNQSQSWTAQKWQDITRGNPYEQFYNVLLEPMKREWQGDVRQAIKDEMNQYQAHQRIDQFEQQNAPWMYATDPASGQRVMSQKGQSFYDEIDRLKEHISDPEILMQVASRLTSGGEQPPAQQPPQQLPPQATPIPPATPAQLSVSAQQSFLSEALQRAQHSPQAGGQMQPTPDDPVNVEEGELNTMFVNAFQTTQRSGPT